MWLSLEEVGEKLLISSKVDISWEVLPEVLWLFVVDEEAVAVPAKVVATTKEAGMVVCGFPVVAVP